MVASALYETVKIVAGIFIFIHLKRDYNTRKIMPPNSGVYKSFLFLRVLVNSLHIEGVASFFIVAGHLQRNLFLFSILKVPHRIYGVNFSLLTFSNPSANLITVLKIYWHSFIKSAKKIK